MTFLLPSGMYCYLHALMGLSSSSDEFCHRSDAVFTGISCVKKLVDDILIEGVDVVDLKNKIKLILDCCATNSFTLSEKNWKLNSIPVFHF